MLCMFTAARRRVEGWRCASKSGPACGDEPARQRGTLAIAFRRIPAKGRVAAKCAAHGGAELHRPET